MSHNPRIPRIARRSDDAAHVFSVGDAVSLVPDLANSAQPKGMFRILRLLPPLGSAFQYRIQAAAGSQEMVVLERQLAPAVPLESTGVFETVSAAKPEP